MRVRCSALSWDSDFKAQHEGTRSYAGNQAYWMTQLKSFYNLLVVCDEDDEMFDIHWIVNHTTILVLTEDNLPYMREK